jgi:hypothetical protein
LRISSTSPTSKSLPISQPRLRLRLRPLPPKPLLPAPPPHPSCETAASTQFVWRKKHILPAPRRRLLANQTPGPRDAAPTRNLPPCHGVKQHAPGRPNGPARNSLGSMPPALARRRAKPAAPATPTGADGGPRSGKSPGCCAPYRISCGCPHAVPPVAGAGPQPYFAAATTASAVMPSSFITVLPGALRPKRSMPRILPSVPTYFHHSAVTPASMAMRLVQDGGRTSSR